jgi:hypothetical protein
VSSSQEKTQTALVLHCGESHHTTPRTTPNWRVANHEPGLRKRLLSSAPSHSFLRHSIRHFKVGQTGKSVGTRASGIKRDREVGHNARKHFQDTVLSKHTTCVQTNNYFYFTSSSHMNFLEGISMRELESEMASRSTRSATQHCLHSQVTQCVVDHSHAIWLHAFQG